MHRVRVAPVPLDDGLGQLPEKLYKATFNLFQQKLIINLIFQVPSIHLHSSLEYLVRRSDLDHGPDDGHEGLLLDQGQHRLHHE